MTYKKICLMLFAVLAVVLIYRIPFYDRWVNSKFNDEADRIYQEMQHLKPEERMEARFRITYDIEMTVVKMLNKEKAQNAIVLLPPASFGAEINVGGESFEVPEPSVFYYFTGYRSVRKNSKEVDRANWALLLRQNKMAVKRINSRASLDTLLTLYKSYN